MHRENPLPAKDNEQGTRDKAKALAARQKTVFLPSIFQAIAMKTEFHFGRRRLPLALLGNALMRIAGGAGGVLVGLYLVDLANRGSAVDATLVGVLGAVSFAAELLGALPMGVLSDRFTPRVLMVGGALLGAIATQMFGLSGLVTIFFLSRALEGLAAAAGAPPILAHLTDVTEGDAALRGKVMSYFELSLLAGLGLGGVVGSQLWTAWGTRAFAAIAVVYLLAAAILLVGAVGSRAQRTEHALSGLTRALREPSLQRLAPAWLCINTIAGLWLGSTLPFLMTLKERRGQYLTGLFAATPERFGYVQLGYVIVFATGVTAWSFFLARFSRVRVLQIALLAMFFACAGFYALNHSQDWSGGARQSLLAGIAVCVMIESGFTPAALALLADVVGAQSGRGAAMGVYSVLLSIGALLGSLLAGLLGERFAVDGLIHGTVAMAVIALLAVEWLKHLAVEEPVQLTYQEEQL
jgi:MFS family permease